MSRPKAYDPQYGYMFQLLLWNRNEGAYEHLDYAVDDDDLDFLLNEYRMNKNVGKIKFEKLPRKYWKEQ